MRIQIYDFGPIKSFEFDLTKDLIVTYGKNNIGKSYAMQFVYLLLKNIIELSSRRRRFNSSYDSEDDLNNEVYSNIFNLLSSSKEKHEITDLINILFTEKFEYILGNRIKTSLKNTFGRSILDGNSRISINTEKYNVDILINNNHLSFENCKITKKVYAKMYSNNKNNFRTINGNEYLYHNDNEIQFKTNINVLSEREIGWFSVEVSNAISNVYFLPASRSGIYSGMSAFSQIIAELAKNRAMLTKKIELPGISEPISDYFITLAEINTKRYNTLNPSIFEEIAIDIENNILKGKVKFDRIKKQLLYIPVNLDSELEMNSVSSMVSEISPIVAYLKYVLEKSYAVNKEYSKPIIFIEEPEAHLHPENQIKLVDIFAKLINLDVKLIMTSHSNYIFNKLNNLILSKAIDFNKYSPILLEQTDNGSIAKHLIIDELGVDDENFKDISEFLYYERSEIINKINAEVSNDTADTEW